MNTEELTKIINDAVDPIMEKRQIEKILQLETEVKSLKAILKVVIHELRTMTVQLEYDDDREVTGVYVELDIDDELYELENQL